MAELADQQPTAAQPDEQVPGPVIPAIMYIGDLLNKSVPGIPAAKAKRIRQLNRNDRNFERTLLGAYSCYELARHWKVLSPSERITLESIWTDFMLRLLSIGNNKVMRSIRYRLREQSPEEDGLEGGRGY
jgi:hypothetical protein